MDRLTRYRLTAAAIVLVLLALTLVWLFTTRLHYTPADGSTWPPKPDTTAMLMPDEYIEPMPVLPPIPGGGSDEGAAPEPPSAQDLVNSGPVADAPAPLNTSTQPSPVTAPAQRPVKPTGPETSDTPDDKPRETQPSPKHTDKLNNWGNGNQTDVSGSGNSNDGPGAGSGSGTGSSRGNRIGKLSGGRKISGIGDVKADRPGYIKVRITVNRDGKVLNAMVIETGGYPPDVVEECRRCAMALKVTPKATAAEEETEEIKFPVRPYRD